MNTFDLTKPIDMVNNEYIAVLIALFIGLYALSLGRMKLPDYIRNLFNNNIFRVVFLSLLLIHNFNRSPHVSLAIALVFVITMQYISDQEIKENFAYLESFRAELRNKRNIKN